MWPKVAVEPGVCATARSSVFSVFEKKNEFMVSFTILKSNIPSHITYKYPCRTDAHATTDAPYTQRGVSVRSEPESRKFAFPTFTTFAWVPFPGPSTSEAES